MKRNLTLIESKQETGITLLALVITIIILLILAGITISAITGDNGIIGNAGQAKEETEIANEKEIVEKATVQAMGKNKYGHIEENELQSELDKETGEGKTETTDIGDEIEVLFKESKRYYLVDKNGNVEGEYTVIEDKNPGDITVGKDGEALDGSEEHPYEIWCVEDLVTFSNMVNGEGIRLENGNSVEITTANNFSGKYVVLKTSLNFKSKLSYQDSERIDFGDINGNENDGNTLMNEMTTGTGFTPIGTGFSTTLGFCGNFNGGDNKISNLYINNSKEDYVGLFGACFYGMYVSNLELEGEITGENIVGGIVGSVAGNGQSSKIENCIVNCNIKGVRNIGGIQGSGVGTIINCINKGEISKNKNDLRTSCYMGGIAGNMAYYKIINCCNLGNVQDNNDTYDSFTYIAGIVGNLVTSDGQILNSYNLGTIAGNCRFAAGIIGCVSSNTVTLNNAYNVGEIKTAKNCAEIIGSVSQHASVEIDNVFFSVQDKGIGEQNGTQTGEMQYYDSDFIKSNEFVNILNAYKNEEGEYPTDWKKWKLGEDEYPTFE